MVMANWHNVLRAINMATSMLLVLPFAVLLGTVTHTAQQNFRASPPKPNRVLSLFRRCSFAFPQNMRRLSRHKQPRPGELLKTRRARRNRHKIRYNMTGISRIAQRPVLLDMASTEEWHHVALKHVLPGGRRTRVHCDEYISSQRYVEA